ncbi:MAG: transcriptional regulator GcvA [Alphaproteobacteria bacterium]|nr:transcriptional regulator GcvA [Alphaproteobacteria bacterium]
MRRLPPLNALRAFVVTAKHLSISKAASELHVSPAAVSQQIKILEQHLGCRLLIRSTRAMSLTEAARACLPDLIEGFARLGDALLRLDELGQGGILTVSVAPSFAAKWLVPRLDLFQSLYPNVDVRISATMNLTDFDAERIDCAIRYGQGGYAPLFVERLLTESVFPVCGPGLLSSLGATRAPSDLARSVLLHDDSPDADPSCPDWRMWLRAAGVAHDDPSRGLHFNQSSLVLEAAIAGQGFALAKARLAEDDLRAGRLVKPFDVSQPLEFAYWFVCPPAKRSTPKVQAFLAWLRQAASIV